ncbi:MAG: hypothetical protein PHU40_06280 [Sulfurimonas sp.]|nr:hypothetical protein [Sulfurimonas sp.]
MALSTVASALEDIKVSGQAKLWYETSDIAGAGYGLPNGAPAVGTVGTPGYIAAIPAERSGDVFSTDESSGEVVFKLAMTGKQGNVGFGATLYQTSTMGLEGVVVSADRTNDTNLHTTNGAPFVGEAYITAPLIASTIMKFGKQELDTPLAFTETWNATPNTFNAAVLVNNSVDNLTLIAAYVGQGNTDGSFKTEGDVTNQYFGTAYAVAGLYKTDAFGVNVWGYQINNALSNGFTWYTAAPATFSGVSVNALWADATFKAGVVNIGAIAAYVTHDGDNAYVSTIDEDATSAFALSADTTVSDITLFAAASTVSEGDLPVANTATGFKKSKLPTEAIYTDGLYVAQPGATAFKLKASGKLGTTGLALQGVMNKNSHDNADSVGALGLSGTADQHETTEVDFIVSQKLGDFNIMGVLMNRSFADNATDDKIGGNYVRVVTSVNF